MILYFQYYRNVKRMPSAGVLASDGLGYSPPPDCKDMRMFMFVELIIIAVLVAIVVIAIRPPRK